MYNPHCLHYQLHDFEGYLTYDLITMFLPPIAMFKGIVQPFELGGETIDYRL